MSEQEPDRISDNLGDVVGAGPTASSSSDAAPGEPMLGPVKDSMNVESPKQAPETDKAKDAPKVDASKDAPGIEAKSEAKPDAPKSPGQILIMPRDQAWNGDNGDSKTQSAGGKSGIFGKRRVTALAAVIALAACGGRHRRRTGDGGFWAYREYRCTKVASTRALEDSISRIDTEVAALRTSLEQASKHSASQIGKTSDRLDKVEKAQAEPAAKLAKLSEAVDKLRTASAAAPRIAPIAGGGPGRAEGKTTGSIQTANAAPVPLPAPKPEIARLPTVEGWVLRDVANGSALIEGRQGIFEVYAGDPIPGLGRVDAIRKQDGRWVVVTSKGLIVAR